MAEIPVGAGSMLEGATVADIQRPHVARLIAIRARDNTHALWALPPGRRLARTDNLVVVATRDGLSQLLGETAERPVDDTVPYRLLEPADRPPAPRTPTGPADQSERSAETRPFGPADTDSTGPA